MIVSINDRIAEKRAAEKSHKLYRKEQDLKSKSEIERLIPIAKGRVKGFGLKVKMVSSVSWGVSQFHNMDLKLVIRMEGCG